MKDKYTILVVDDNNEIRDIIRQFLQLDGKNVLEADDGTVALEKMSDDVDLVIMDVSMPDMNGDEACRLIRQERTCPVIFLTAYGDEDTQKRCFEYGVDDFLVKPFKYSELLLHVNALLRRCYEYGSQKQVKSRENDTLTMGNLRLEPKSKKIYYDGKDLHITYTEYSIFEFLLKHRGETFSIDKIYENVWDEMYCNESANTVMVHIRNLRRKLEKTGQEYLFNAWGKGYYVD